MSYTLQITPLWRWQRQMAETCRGLRCL